MRGISERYYSIRKEKKDSVGICFRVTGDPEKEQEKQERKKERKGV
jgi:hypothetical protein